MAFISGRSGYISPKATGQSSLRQNAQKLKATGAIQTKKKPVSTAQKNARTLGQVIRGAK